MDSHHDLIRRWRSGSTQAAQALVNEYYPRLLNFFYRLTGSREQAEDLTQDLFVRLTQQVVADGLTGHLGAWLHTTASNLWRDRVRREMNARTKGITTAGGDDEVLHYPGPDEVETAVIASWQQEAVRQAVLTLGPKQREVIVLYHYQGLAYEEIARVVGVPIGTVRSRLHYAIEALRASLRLEWKE